MNVNSYYGKMDCRSGGACYTRPMDGSPSVPSIGSIAFENDPSRWLAASSNYIPPRQQRSRLALERIVAAAMRLFTQNGYDATPVSEIAASAGVPVGTLYQRFPDKDAILMTILDGYRRFRIQEIRRLCSTMDGRPHDAVDIVRLHVNIIFSAFRTDIGLLRLMETRRLTDRSAYADLVEANREVVDQIVALLTPCLRQRDPVHLARQVGYVHNIIRGSVVWATLPQVAPSADTLDIADPGFAAAALDMALRYLEITPKPETAGR